MAIYLKKFETISQYNAYTADTENFILPNVSLTVDNNMVYYNPSVPVPPTPTETRVVAKYYVESAGSTITLFHIEEGSGSGAGNGGEPLFSSMEIDGVEQSEVVNEYTFNTAGEHTVKYTLIDPTSIGASAFNACRSLTSITIPNSVTSIGSQAFDCCSGLTSCTIGSGVTSIGDAVFASCSGLTSIDIPSGVTSIGDYAFYRCSSLTSIVIPDSVTTIGYRAFTYCSGLTSCTIGSGVTSIGNSAFQNCISLSSINIPSGVTSIGEMAFYYCSGLTSCTIGSGVTSFGMSAFAGCSGLTSIVIPSSVTSIGNYAFASCSSLTSITSNATTAPTIQSYTFNGVKTGGTLYVPQGSSGYDVWMGTGDYYLGKYGWTKVEQ